MMASSILNDVLGPIMCGPSSSHTAGPGKIGLAVSQLWGRPIRYAMITYDQSGSYPGTHVGQGSDFGFAAGLMGYTTDNVDFRLSLEIAAQRGVSVRFAFGDLGAHHPNEARLEVCPDEGCPALLSVLSQSTGGGTFLLTELNGYPIAFNGQRKVFFLGCQAQARQRVADGLSAAGLRFEVHTPASDAVTRLPSLKAEGVLFEIQAPSPALETLPDGLLDQDELLFLYSAGPLVPAPLRLESSLPFATAKEAEAYAEVRGIPSPAAIALDYELALGSLSRREARERMNDVLDAMRLSMTPPPKDDPVHTLILPPHAQRLSRLQGLPLNMGVLNGCMASAIAVMENSCAHRVIVAAPTAGASGVIPAAILSVGDQLRLPKETLLEGLWTAGLVGAFIANQATFGAEVAGCQAEIGAAACMAAAGVVQLLGGSVAQAFNAASIAMHSFLGLICDPIGGLTEIPCIERNVTAASVAVTSANMALCGFDPMIPLDESIQTMLRVGQQLPSALRCTCEGGLCVTPCGQRLGRLAAEAQACAGLSNGGPKR